MSNEPELNLLSVIEHVIKNSYKYPSSIKLISANNSYGEDYCGFCHIAFEYDDEDVDRLADKIFDTTTCLFGKPCIVYAYRGRVELKPLNCNLGTNNDDENVV